MSVRVVPPPSLSILRPVRIHGVETHEDIFHGRFIYPRLISVEVDPTLTLMAKGVVTNGTNVTNGSNAPSASQPNVDWKQTLPGLVNDLFPLPGMTGLSGTGTTTATEFNLQKQEQKAEEMTSSLMANIPSLTSTSVQNDGPQLGRFTSDVNAQGFEMPEQIYQTIPGTASTSVEFTGPVNSGNVSFPVIPGPGPTDMMGTSYPGNSATIPDELFSIFQPTSNFGTYQGPPYQSQQGQGPGFSTWPTQQGPQPFRF